MAVRKKSTLIKSLSELKKADYAQVPELKDMYERLEKGRSQLAEVFDKNIKAVMQISSLDLTMQHQTEKIMDISRKVEKASETIFGASIDSGDMGDNNSRHEELTNTIIDVSAETDHVYRKIEEGQNELTTIKELSDQTIQISEKLQNDMDGLFKMIDRIGEIISGIDTISMQTNLLALNASIEELSSSMSEMENQLRDSIGFMKQVGGDLGQAVKPVVDIEKTLDDAVKEMGDMTEDAFYHLENFEFSKYVSNAITAHNTWLFNLKNMVKERTVMPLQLDSSKCGFGHFYYALTPQIPDVLTIWNALGEKHKRFHAYGAEVIQALNNGEYPRAEQLCRETEEYSRGLISDLQAIIRLAGE